MIKSATTSSWSLLSSISQYEIEGNFFNSTYTFQHYKYDRDKADLYPVALAHATASDRVIPKQSYIGVVAMEPEMIICIIAVW